MKPVVRTILLAATLIFFADLARAGEDDIRLKAGEGLEVVEQHCAACHSLDYIQMNSPFLDEKGWQASVTKMVKTFGAPVTEGEQMKIVAYLVARYGKE